MLISSIKNAPAVMMQLSVDSASRSIVRLLTSLLFKIVQITVAAFFTLLVFAQTFLAGIERLFSEPAAKQKVDSARQQSCPAAVVGDTCTADASSGHSPRRKQQHSDGFRQRVAKQQQQQGDDCTADDSITASPCPGSASPIHIFPQPELGHDSEAWRLIGPYMRQYGRHAIANSQLFNPEFIHFFVPGVGSMPYVIVELYNRAAIFGIGEPLAPRSAWRQLVQLFLAEYPEAYFHHITEDFADVLHEMGYWINSAGSETALQVQSWAYTAKTRTVRAAARAARESGVRVRELAPEELTDEMRHKLQHDVSGDWHQQKAIADRHLRVYVRNVDYDTVQLRDGVRIFVAEAYEPAFAPPAEVDPALQGAALNAKPPKPPRVKRSQSAVGSSLSSHSSAPQFRTASCGSISSLPSINTPAGLNTWLSGPLGKPPAAAAASPKTAQDSNISDAFVTGASSSSITISSSSIDGSSSGSSSPKSPCVLVKVQADCTSAKAYVPNRTATNAPTAVAAAAAAAAGSGDEGGSDATAGPKLIGFVLLDPLWEGGEEVGYVTSMMRMKRSAHTGTLKLLLEDIISKLRKEGRRELTFGFAPLFNLRDTHHDRRYIHWLNWVQNYIFFCANNVYAFKNLAFSKVRYGAGLDDKGKQYRDPNVTLSNVYMASKRYMPGFNILDLYGFLTYIGLVDTPISTFAKLVGLTKGGANLK